MPKPYSEDLRVRVVRAVDGGGSRRSVALKFAVSPSFVVRLLQHWRADQTITPRSGKRGRSYALEAYGELIDRLLSETCDITLEELRTRLAAEGVTVGRSSIDRYLKARGLTRKKRQGMHQNRSAPTLRPPALPGERRNRG